VEGDQVGKIRSNPVADLRREGVRDNGVSNGDGLSRELVGGGVATGRKIRVR
jgi:hypothetical protein